ncbi:MAG: 4-hydroxybenzoate octaprenyltransferase [Hyphomicrobiales bacterium]|nr:4-hydroxybenzoate octaprenyltransferase [Hyphomicrobiales bacterium]
MSERNIDRVADAAKENLVDRLAPEWARPYAQLARLDRPIGWQLLLWPCWWSAALAAGPAGWAGPDPVHLILFLIGAVAMRGAGCTYNDIVDRDFDADVARTRSRPIPSGRVTVFQAMAYIVALCLVGLAVLVQFNGFAIFLGFASVPIILVYPFMKRITWWPQATLGLAFSWGALMGWAAVFGRLDPPAVLLYVGGILWTIGYDTVYAHQDKEDDALIGVRSTARLFAEHTKTWLTVLYGGALVLWIIAGVAAKTVGVFHVALGLAALHMIWQIMALDIDNADRCLAIFKSNRDFGWILFLGLIGDSLTRNGF